MKTKILLFGIAAGVIVIASAAASPARPAFHDSFPSGVISNQHLLVRYYIPDPEKGYYRGTRFEWSGMVPEVVSRGHTFFCEFREGHDPYNHDDVCGTAEEFDIRGPASFAGAGAGEGFLKIGVGVLERFDDTPYAFTKRYKILNGGKWSIRQNKGEAVFTHDLTQGGQWSYEYIKTLRLSGDSPELVIHRQLRNRGGKPLETEHYGHNFLQIDRSPAGPDYEMELPFVPAFVEGGTTHGTLRIEGRKILFLSELSASQAVWTALTGFQAPSDHRLTFRNRRTGAEMVLIGDRPLARLAYYSSGGVLCPEPFVKISVAPGSTTEWSTTYRFTTN